MTKYPYRYETHMHTSEGSRCARMSAKEQIEFYARRGYAGVFITDHFWGNSSCTVDSSLDFEKQVELFFETEEKAKAYGQELGIDVFCGLEYTWNGLDLLVYGLGARELSKFPEIPELKPRDFANLIRENGGLVIQAHPFRPHWQTKVIRVIPRFADGFEVLNGANSEHQDRMAEIAGKEYKLLKFAGSDNHGIIKGTTRFLAGVDTTRRVKDERDFVDIIKNGKYRIFGGEREPIV